MENQKLELTKYLINFLIVTLNNILILDHDLNITDLQRSWSSFQYENTFKFYDKNLIYILHEREVVRNETNLMRF